MMIQQSAHPCTACVGPDNFKLFLGGMIGDDYALKSAIYCFYDKIYLEFWNGNKALVTGNTGFKGPWLSTALLEFCADVKLLLDRF